MKKKHQWLVGLSLLVSTVALSACQATTQTNEASATRESNFYQAVNQEWLKKTEIPSDQPGVDSFSELSTEIDDHMKEDIQGLISGKEQSDIGGMSEFIKFYHLTHDFDKIEKEGSAPIKPYLEVVEKVQDLDALAAETKEWTLNGTTLPFSIYVSSDLEDTSKNIIELGMPSTILPDVSYYEDKTQKEELLALYKESAVKVLTLMDYSKKDAEKIVDEAIAFDALLVPYTPSSEEASSMEATFNIRNQEQVAAYSSHFSLNQVINELVGKEVDRINVTQPTYFENLDKIVNKEHFQELKSWILLNEAMSGATYLNDDLRLAAGEFGRALSGVTEAASKEDSAYAKSVSVFSDTMSVYYGKKYFGQEAKTEVTSMIDGIIAVYKKRLAEKDWLSEATRQEAIKKLEHMTYYVGYPEDVSEETKAIRIDEKKSVLENVVRLSQEGTRESFATFGETVDKDVWSSPSYEVNAFYNPTNNSITFPAAILQAPFYSKEQSEEANYGGIGAVIGHEITHAFDSNGALFDEYGNLKNWWTDADRAAFDQKIEAVEKQWDGLEIYGEKVNGKLTVTENVADAGGISAALEALKVSNSDADLKKYFESWARIWRSKYQEEYARLMLASDVHSPNELRANVQVKNLDAFYEVYGITEKDAMYLEPSKRVSVW